MAGNKKIEMADLTINDNVKNAISELQSETKIKISDISDIIDVITRMHTGNEVADFAVMDCFVTLVQIKDLFVQLKGNPVYGSTKSE